MNGVENDFILIPRGIVVDVDYSLVSEDHSKIRHLMEKVRRSEPIQRGREGLRLSSSFLRVCFR
ncbi:MAG: hypothetical protein ACOYIP_06955 [Coriobacteriales bacterium]|jgi:hypothetical protein